MPCHQSPGTRCSSAFTNRTSNTSKISSAKMGKRIVDRSVDTGNIKDTSLKTATVRQKIRDEYIRDATVTIVLIGPRTWQRNARGLGDQFKHQEDQEEP